MTTPQGPAPPPRTAQNSSVSSDHSASPPSAWVTRVPLVLATATLPSAITISTSSTLTWPEDDEDLESASVTPTFRRAKMHLLPTWDISLGHQMNSEDRDTLHFTSMFV